MKIILLNIIAITSLFAFSGEVKKDTVELQINESISKYEKGAKITLHGGDFVCFVSGNGRIVIQGDGYKKQLSKRSRSCKVLPIVKDKENKESYLDSSKNMVVSFFAVAEEKAVDGASRKSIVQDNNSQAVEMHLSNENSFVKIQSISWGPLPVTLKVFDQDGTLVDTMVNEEEIKTSFIFPASRVKNRYTLQVSNAFDEKLAVIKIKKEGE
jgi:hypothetical protein